MRYHIRARLHARAMTRASLRESALACLRILGCGLVAFIAGGLTIDWLGTGWYGTLSAVLTAMSVMVFALKRPEVPHGPA